MPKGNFGVSDIITGTPPELTYDHRLVREAWTVSWIIASGALAAIIGWAGLSMIVQEHLGQMQTGWREIVPRLVLGIVAAASSLWWCALVIDIADAVSGYIAASLGVTVGDLLRANLTTLMTAIEAGTVGIAILVAILYLVYCLFVVYVLVQMVVRLALVDVLLAIAPIALGLWILPHTAGWGRHWLRLFTAAVFQQAVQLVALALGFGFLSEFAAIAAFEPVRDLVWKLLLSLGFIVVASRVPSLMGGHSTFDAWLHTIHFGASLPTTAYRSARSFGIIAGGSAAGPVGVAAAAAGVGAAKGAASAATGSMGPAPGTSNSGAAPRSSSE